MIVCADARRIPLADGSVQCVVTSPPYWGLRKYAGEQELIWESDARSSGAILECRDTGHDFAEETRNGIGGGQNQNSKSENPNGATNRPLEPTTHSTCRKCGAWRGGYGLEPTVEMYVAHSLEILRELRRVLRKDGVLFWNLGDSYNATPNQRSADDVAGTKQASCRGSRDVPSRSVSGLKPKDLVLMPARIALAAQADGWWVRSVIVWAKPNPMPESVTDRPTDAYEHILMLTKSERYFWDADAVREQAVAGWNGSRFDTDRKNEIYKTAYGYSPKGAHSRGNGNGGPKAQERGSYEGFAESAREVLGSRNMRNVWMFATQPYSGAHFATFPEELPRRCILAASSERGACRFCGAPWRRVVRITGGTIGQGSWTNHDWDETLALANERETVGWRPTCLCRGQRGQTRACVVLDPFGGSGTTAQVAIELNRQPVLLDLAYNATTDKHYADLAKARTSEVQRSLPLL